jgi:F0F1-type ATP synthase delta subunit
MKYPAHIYAKALAEAIADAKGKAQEDAVVTNFLALVERSGDEVHLRKILEEAARMARGKEGIRKVVLESARPLTIKQRKELTQFTGPKDVVQERIDPALMAGIRIFLDDETEFDGSLKGKLDRIFDNQ